MTYPYQELIERIRGEITDLERIVQRTLQGQVQVAWVGDLATKQQQPLEFRRLETARVEFPEWRETPTAEGDLDISGLLDIAADPRRLGRGESVLIGWNDDTLPGLNIRPVASQLTVRTVFVSQLRHAVRPPPRRDRNSFPELFREQREVDQVDFY